MPASIAVYCKRSVALITPVQVFTALQEADFWTLAESRYIPPFRVQQALGDLKIENVGSGGFLEYALSYRPAPLPQCVVRRLALAEGVHDPALDELEGLHHPGIDRIRRHVKQAKDVVTLELSSMPDQQMTALLASEIARWLAEMGDGMIARSDQTWWDLDDLAAYRRILP